MTVKRSSILAAVISAFEGITVANGYYSDLGNNVYEWRGKIIIDGQIAYVPTFEDEELPSLHVRDPLDRVTSMNMKRDENHELTLEAEIAHDPGATGVTMRKQIADVIRAIGIDQSWGGLAIKTSQEISTDTIRIHGERSFYRTLITARIHYTTSGFSEE